MAGLQTSQVILSYSGEVFDCDEFFLTAEVYNRKFPFIHFNMKCVWSVSKFKSGIQNFKSFLLLMYNSGYPFVFAAVTEDKLKWEKMIGMKLLVSLEDSFIVGRQTDGD